MNDILENPREYKRRREVFLDQQFHERYPEGMFTLQRRLGWMVKEVKTFAIYWRPHRRHGTCHEYHCQAGKYPNSKLIAAVYRTEGDPYYPPGLLYESYQNNSFGKCTYYTSLQTALTAAKRLNFPEELINGFLKKHKEVSR